MLIPSFPTVHLPMLENVPLPLLMRVRLPHPRGNPIVDIEGKIAQELAGAKKLNALPPGAKVAVGIGSRGVAHIPRLARAVVAYLKEKGYEPFIVPTMGSHGGGVAEGQAGVLEELGVTEATVGAPVKATMEVVEFGTTSDGIPCCMDANAAAADGVVFVARVKAHTSFLRDIESGLCKMVGIGFGKAQGARNIHRLGPKGYCKVLPELAAIMAEKSPLVCGVGVVENGYDDITEIEAVEPENFQAADRRLLIEARKVHQKLPFAQMDAMIVEWIGKEISGSGMDPVVTGRYDFRDEYLTGWAEPAPDRPVVVKLGVLGVTPDDARQCRRYRYGGLYPQRPDPGDRPVFDVFQRFDRAPGRSMQDPGGAADREGHHHHVRLRFLARAVGGHPHGHHPIDHASGRGSGFAEPVRRYREHEGRRGSFRSRADRVRRRRPLGQPRVAARRLQIARRGIGASPSNSEEYGNIQEENATERKSAARNIRAADVFLFARETDYSAPPPMDAVLLRSMDCSAR